VRRHPGHLRGRRQRAAQRRRLAEPARQGPQPRARPAGPHHRRRDHCRRADGHVRRAERRRAGAGSGCCVLGPRAGRLPTRRGHPGGRSAGRQADRAAAGRRVVGAGVAGDCCSRGPAAGHGRAASVGLLLLAFGLANGGRGPGDGRAPAPQASQEVSWSGSHHGVIDAAER
jgi:hypothetical protein